MKKSKKRILIFLIAILTAFVIKGLDTGLVVRSYTVESEKLAESVRLVFLSDLHSCAYGEEQKELLDLVDEQEPDLVFLGGDWVDDDFGHLPPERAYLTARALAEKYPTFYAVGNHELWSGYADEIKFYMASQGVNVLSGESQALTINGQVLLICGVDDSDVGEDIWMEELSAVRETGNSEDFRLLLSHRPERVEDYSGFDVILAGHAHGGQWRIPLLLNGLFAPNQGLFPAYAGGSYTTESGGQLIVSRGLSRESTRVPRFWNPPEVVVIDLVPAV